MEKLLTTEQPLSKEEDQMRSWTLLSRTSELLHILDSLHLGVNCLRAKAGSSALSEWWTFGFARPSLLVFPFFWRNRGDDSLIKKIFFIQMEGDSFYRLMGFYDKCLRVHSGNFRWETWKGCKSFRYYIWNWTRWKPFRRDVWVKALRNVNLLSLKLCNTEYEVWFTFMLRILFLRTFYLTCVCFSFTFKTSWLEFRVFLSEQLS